MKPSVLGHRLPPETQNKLTKGIALKGQTNIQEMYMVVMVEMGMLNSFPHRDFCRMIGGINGLLRGQEPHIGIFAGIYAHASPNNLFVQEGEKHT